jgi:hypothetical protein
MIGGQWGLSVPVLKMPMPIAFRIAASRLGLNPKQIGRIRVFG